MYLFKTPIMPVPPNKIKYSTVYDGKSIKADNFSIGVNSDVDYGPTLSTNYWNGIVPPISGYAVYINKGSQGPSIYAPQNDAQLVSITNFLAGSKVANNATDALFWFNSQSDKFVTNIDYPDVVTNGLSMMVDAGYVSSYCRSGSTWNDLSFSGFNATLQSSPTFTLSGNGYFNFALASSQYATFSDLGTLSNFSCEVWVKQNTLPPSSTYVPAFITNTYVSGNYVNYSIGYLNPAQDSKIYGGFFNAGWKLHSTGFSPTTDRWYHYAVTFNGTNIIFYVDGIYYSSGTTASPALTSGSGGRLMRRWDDTNYIDGNLLNAKVYNRALSSTEVKRNFYAHGLPVNFVSTNLLAFLDAGNILSYYGSGSVWKDMSSNSNNGTLSVAPSYSSGNKGILTFNGSTQYVLLPTNFFNPDSGTPFSVSIWFRTSNAYGTILGQQDTNTPGTATGWVPAIYVDTSGKLRISCFWGGASTPTASTNSVNDGLWHNITVTYASNLQKIYLDGVFDKSFAFTPTTYSATYYYFLGSGKATSWTLAGQNFFGGDIAMFAFYTKELTASEVSQNYNATKSRFGL